MKLTHIMVALALTSAVLPAVAMQRMTEVELSQIRGREGVTILADLKVQIGSLTRFSPLAQALYQLNDLMLSGLMGATVDVLTDAQYTTALSDSLRAYGIKDADMAGVISSVGQAAAAVPGANVVQIAFPALPVSAVGTTFNIAVASANTGASGASMGGLVIKDINPAGTKIWLLGHSR